MSEGCGRKLQLFLILGVCPLDILTTFLNCVRLDARTLSTYEINVSLSTLSSVIPDDKRKLFLNFQSFVLQTFLNIK